MYFHGPPHMAGQKQVDQLEHAYSSYVRIRDVALKTCQRRWTIGRSGERGSGISVLAARHDDDIFPKGINLKENVITRLEFELAYSDVAFQLVVMWKKKERLITVADNSKWHKDKTREKQLLSLENKNRKKTILWILYVIH